MVRQSRANPWATRHRKPHLSLWKGLKQRALYWLCVVWGFSALDAWHPRRCSLPSLDAEVRAVASQVRAAHGGRGFLPGEWCKEATAACGRTSLPTLAAGRAWGALDTRKGLCSLSSVVRHVGHRHRQCTQVKINWGLSQRRNWRNRAWKIPKGFKQTQPHITISVVSHYLSQNTWF